ncbi:DEAD-box ATP-dependent RNA helicase 16-like [Silene latifolia]|uniref:DEAD-box ATP-dependent RNA helicase 16-like n=1 Tax=Silene latifolia TaxID=37657 RepID=UPI003D779EC3
MADVEVEFEELNLEDIGVECFTISCGPREKFLHILALLDLDLVLKKVVLFINTIDMGFTLKLFLERFGISSAFLFPELPQNSRLHIIEEFNSGLFDCLIAITDDVITGIDFKNVCTVINLDMPSTAAGYINGIRRERRVSNTRTLIFLVSPDEMEAFGELKLTRSGGVGFIAPFPSLTRRMVELLRYQAEDIESTVTGVDVRRARAEAIHGTKFEDILGTETETETEDEILTIRFISK